MNEDTKELNSSEYIKKAFELQQNQHYKSAIEMLYKALALEQDNKEIISQIAHIYYLMGNLDRAVEYWEKVLDFSKNNLFAKNNLIEIYTKTGKKPLATRLAKEVFECKEDLVSFVKYLECLFSEGLFEQLIKEIELSAYNNGTSDAIECLKGSSFVELEDITTAKSHYEKSVEINGKNPKSLLALAKIHYSFGDTTAAEDYARKVVEISPNAEAKNLLGLVELSKNNIPKAIKSFTSAIAEKPDNAEYYYNLGTAYALYGWILEAEKNFKAAIIKAHDNTTYRYALAHLYYEKNELDKATEQLGFIKSKDSSDKNTNILEALILAKQGQIVLAKNRLLELSTQIQNSDFIFYALGKIYKDLDNHAQAAHYFKKSVKLKPTSKEYLSELADTLLKNKEIEKAREIAAEILDLNKNYIFAHILLAKIYLMSGMEKEALEHAQTAIKLDSNADYAYYLKSKILAKNGDSKAAIENLKTAITLAPATAKYYAAAGEILAAESDYDSACLYYRESNAIEPENIGYKYSLAKCYAKLDDFHNANLHFSQLKRLDAENPHITADYAELLYRNGKEKAGEKVILRTIKATKNEAIKKSLKEKNEALEADYPRKKRLFGLF